MTMPLDFDNPREEPTLGLVTSAKKQRRIPITPEISEKVLGLRQVQYKTKKELRALHEHHLLEEKVKAQKAGIDAVEGRWPT